MRRVLQLYREQYQGFNIRHFHELARRDHGVTLSYRLVRFALQEAGLVRRRRARGCHRRRREPRARFGELLHLDGSPHAWLALCPEERQTLIVVLDDATKQLLYAQLWPAETLHAVMTALGHVLHTEGLPEALYTDRAGWAFVTPKAGAPVDRTQLTQLGRALARRGIEHIGAYSPQARGRGERVNRTLQDRLVNELRPAGLRTLEAANAYLREHFIADYNARFTRPPAAAPAAFVPLGALDVDQLLCEEDARVVGHDNVVQFDGVALQLAKQPGRPTCARPRSSCDATWTALTRSGAARCALAGLTPRAARSPPRPQLRLRRARRRIGPRLPVGPTG